MVLLHSFAINDNVGGRSGRREAAVAMDEFWDEIVCWGCRVMNLGQLVRLEHRHDR